MQPLVILFYFLKKQCIHMWRQETQLAQTGTEGVPANRHYIYMDIHTPPFFLLPRSNNFNNLGTVFVQVYICGGFNGNECLFTAEVYNTESNQWTVIAPMRSRRSGIGVIAYGEHVYAVSLSWTTKTKTLDVLLSNRFTLPLVSI